MSTGTRPVALPDAEECRRLLRGSGCSDDVIRHCEAVASLAVRIARRCGADIRLVEVGALLHDLGRCRTHSIEHAVVGADMARGLGLPEEVALLIERHIGAGLSADEARAAGLPVKDYTPVSLEEKIVAHADNLTSGTGRMKIEDAVSELVRRGLQDAALKVARLDRELSGIAGTDLDDLR